MPWGMIGFLAVCYFIIIFGVPRLVSEAHKRLVIKRKMVKAKTALERKKIPTTLHSRLAPLVAFARVDNRPIGGSGVSYKNVSLLVLVGGLVSFCLAPVYDWRLLLAGPIALVFLVSWVVKTASPVVKTRKSVIDRMFIVAKNKLGVSADFESEPHKVINIVEWRDHVKPNKVVMSIPESFSESGEKGFLQQFNQIFGRETTWIPDDDFPNGKYGWDYDAGELTLMCVPPLPTLANWDPRYVLDPNVSWSFFPIGLSTMHGLEVPLPGSDDIERVVGFDVLGQQASMSAKEGGYPVSSKISASPMGLISGTTGGGKSLDVDTIILVKKQDETKE